MVKIDIKLPKVGGSMSNQTVIDKILTYAKNQMVERDDFLSFIPCYYANVSKEDLDERTIHDLYGAALSHWRLVKDTQKGEVKLSVFNPNDTNAGWQSPHTIIQIISPDAPFLVDSVRMFINAQSEDISLLLHTGGIRVARGNDGGIKHILAFTDEVANSDIIAPIALEVTHVANIDRIKEIESGLTIALNDTLLAVNDWQPMVSVVNQAINDLETAKSIVDKDLVEESQAFLKWLINKHFTFIGCREYQVVGEGDAKVLQMIKGSGLGVLRDETTSKIFRQYIDMPPQVRHMIDSKKQLIITSKTNTQSTVHRPAYTDCIDIKIFNSQHQLIKIVRVIGLYTSLVYNSSDLSQIPIFRKKVATILSQSGLPRQSHGGKDLLHILATLPRDELFHGSVDELFDLSMGILRLQERRRIRLFIRKDPFYRYYSCLVFLPRDIFNTAIIYRFKDILMEKLGGKEFVYTTHFSDSNLARIHYVIRLDLKENQKIDSKEIEVILAKAGKSWRDGFSDHLIDYFGETVGRTLLNKYKTIPISYQERFPLAGHAIIDVEHIEKLDDDNPIEMCFYRPLGIDANMVHLKLYKRDTTFSLSDALPMLENMGLKMIGERPYELTMANGNKVWINDFNMFSIYGKDLDTTNVKQDFRELFLKLLNGNIESDLFNSLVLVAGLNWWQIAMVRALARYMKQIGFGLSQTYIAETLIAYPDISKDLWLLFDARFNPGLKGNRKEKCDAICKQIKQALNDVQELDQDRILRSYMHVILSTMRTNFYQTNDRKENKPYLSFKISSSQLSGLPLPVPKFEIFIYSPRVEGIHIRLNSSNATPNLKEETIARGGLRWSTRREDYRQEVLGLAKAQRVKNAGAGIVPTGAKGGFITKQLAAEATREQMLEEGIACYQLFISGLLDVVDNVKDTLIIQPKDTVCHDQNDAYLVVAADKGTATFSDIANELALQRGFWMGDAFASGGSTGYDHKKMGITARGAWVSVEHHFKQISINVNEQDISVIGIGDMAGDVFGNGMLMTRHIQLKAAFNHMHIFIDPNPNADTSYTERLRLFKLPRSSWDDYSPELISSGGGVFSRRAKSIHISEEIKEWLEISTDIVTPNELIGYILRSEADLLWNGGIGTFVKASSENHVDVGDRTNDDIRVNAPELRVKVIGEGGNLGITPLARIEYEIETGGLINTDFIDNAGGVDCSDHEVNIKILLNKLVDSGEMTEKKRNQILSDRERDVANLVLLNNYRQNEALAYVSSQCIDYRDLYCRYLDNEEVQGHIDRALEYLPSQKTLNDRLISNKAFTRSELAIIMSYSKITLNDHIRKGSLLKDPDYNKYLLQSFPDKIYEDFPEVILSHPLKNQIIATQLSAQLVSDMGFWFVYQLQDETGASVDSILRAYTIAHEVFDMSRMLNLIKQLDYSVPATIQHRMRKIVVGLIRRSARWFLRNAEQPLSVSEMVSRFKPQVDALYSRLPKLLFGNDKKTFLNEQTTFTDAGVPQNIARRISSCTIMYHMLNIIESVSDVDMDIYRVAKIYFMMLDRLDLLWFRDHINHFPSDTRWSVLSKAAYKSDLDDVQRSLTISILEFKTESKSIPGRINAWFHQYESLLIRWKQMLADMHATGSADFSILSVAIRELKEVSDLVD